MHQVQEHYTYAVNFRSANVDNSFSEVLGQVVINTLYPANAEELLLQAIPYMPYYTTAIQLTNIDNDDPCRRYTNKFYQIANGEIKEVDFNEEWEKYRFVDKYKNNLEVRPYYSRVLKIFNPSVAEVKEARKTAQTS
jgi:hypothetical protein